MKITFTGSHGTGKTTAVKVLNKVLNEEYPKGTLASIGSVTRSVIGWGNGILTPEENSFQLACIYDRRKQMVSKTSLASDFVISERWAMDETAYQAYKFSQNKMNRNSSHTLRVCKMEMDWEFENYWDRVYFIPVTDRPVESDGVRPTSKDYQLEIDRYVEDSLKSFGPSIKIKTVPTKLEELEEFFRKDIRSWKKISTSGES